MSMVSPSRKGPSRFSAAVGVRRAVLRATDVRALRPRVANQRPSPHRNLPFSVAFHTVYGLGPVGAVARRQPIEKFLAHIRNDKNFSKGRYAIPSWVGSCIN